MLAVLGALFANALIALLKLVAAWITGSSGMMAEALTRLPIQQIRSFCY
jgi:divalent metal cation (Fe/Co/Zn/Cd) transporter